MIEWLTTIMLFLLCVYMAQDTIKMKNTADKMREARIARGKAFSAHLEWMDKPTPKKWICNPCHFKLNSPTNGNCHYCRRE